MKILIGITGSVAATISHKIVRAMEEVEGCEEVAVVMTDSATRFMSSSRLKTLTNVKVYTEADEWMWKTNNGEMTDIWEKDFPVLHIELAKKFDLLVIAPATANTIAKLGNGICDNLLTSVYAAWRGRSRSVIIAPSMNTYMWTSSNNNDNISKIDYRGNRIIYPQCKTLACGDYGFGAMANISDIVNEVKEFAYENGILRGV